jgi:hypothetical protein
VVGMSDQEEEDDGFVAFEEDAGEEAGLEEKRAHDRFKVIGERAVTVTVAVRAVRREQEERRRAVRRRAARRKVLRLRRFCMWGTCRTASSRRRCSSTSRSLARL